MSAVRLLTSDGHELDGDLAEAEGTARGAVAICHPHPLYGGDRSNPVVDALFSALPHAGFRTIRFDFRAAHDNGVAERRDLVAALDHVVVEGLPAFAVGYSFGALVALSTPDRRVAGIVAVAPPLGENAPAPHAPTLVLTPRHDQFCPPETAGAAVAGWLDVEADVIESADHFLVGSARPVAARAAAWLTARS